MKKILALGVASLVVAGATTFGVANVSAYRGDSNGAGTGTALRDGSGAGQGAQGGGYQASLEARAKIVGMNADELKKALETKTMDQILTDKKISEETFQNKVREASKARWESRGLSADEVQKRVADQQKRQAENQENCDGTGNHEGQSQNGYGRNRA